MRPILVFESPTTETTNNFKNEMLQVIIENMEVFNMTFYEPATENALIGKFHDDIKILTMKNLKFHDIE